MSTVPKEHPLFQEVESDLISLFRDKLNRKDWEQIVQQRVDMKRGKEIIERIGDAISYDNAVILDVGSGWGELQYELSQPQYNAQHIYGIEPHDKLLQLSKIILDGNTKTTVTQGVVEQLPFEDNTFDIVICYTVLEHVQDYKKAVSEMLRVLKPGGKIYVFAPNYLFPREGHYRMTFPAMLGKRLGHWYLQVMKKDTEFFDRWVEPIYSWGVLRYLKQNNIQYEDKARKWYSTRSLPYRMLGALRLYVNMELVITKK